MTIRTTAAPHPPFSALLPRAAPCHSLWVSVSVASASTLHWRRQATSTSASTLRLRVVTSPAASGCLSTLTPTRHIRDRRIAIALEIAKMTRVSVYSGALVVFVAGTSLLSLLPTMTSSPTRPSDVAKPTSMGRRRITGIRSR